MYHLLHTDATAVSINISDITPTIYVYDVICSAASGRIKDCLTYIQNSSSPCDSVAGIQCYGKSINPDDLVNVVV